MTDTKELLPKSRAFFRKFKQSHFNDYFECMRESRVGPGSGYSHFYRANEVIQHIRDIVHNLDETFGDVKIPEDFTSPKRLVETWQWFREFLLSRNLLFDNVLATVENLPEPFYWIRKVHIDTLGLLEEILSMNEVKEYTSTLKDKKKSDSVHFDIVIITALHDTEFEAIKKMPVTFTPYPVAHDTTNYLEGKIGKKSILIATDDTMGIAAATSLSTKVIAKFSPSYLIMGGIAAGVKDKEKNYGDILVSRFTWNYESGKYKFNTKTKSTVFVPNPEPIELDSVLILNLSL